jgi:hypothetical protein
MDVVVGVTEIAGLINVSRQRADQISRTKGFPDPVQELASGRLWLQADVEAWARAMRDHFCLPAGPPTGDTRTRPCEECGRVWEWQSIGAWKNSVAPDVGPLSGNPATA